ncbi:MAG TPA: hypothetical protein VFK13_05405 [Gemmatimonadaceae bacterium]|nr:hypothetical protein [Gemmatimonadaceae bacterium]
MAVAALVLLIGPAVWQAVWRVQHPAPLGRSAAEVDSALARLLPVGTSLDSTEALLHVLGIAYSVIEPDDQNATRDTIAAGGPIVMAGLQELDTKLFITEGAGIRLAFDPSRRLARRKVEPWFTGL